MNLDLKKLLDIVTPAVADEQATQVGARMVQVFEKRIWAYGGDFCISHPCELDVSVAFMPQPVRNFFKLDRQEVTFIATASDLTIKSAKPKKAHVTVPTMDRADVTVLTVFGDLIEASLHKSNVKFAARLAEPDSDRPFARGVLFRSGAVWCGKGLDLFCGASGIPEGVPDFVISKASALILAAQKAPLRGIVLDVNSLYAVEFQFADETNIAVRTQEVAVPDIGPVFEFDILSTFKLSEGMREEVDAAVCERWHIQHDRLTYITADKDKRLQTAVGVIEGKTGLDRKAFPQGILISDKLFRQGLELSDGQCAAFANGIYFHGPEGSYAACRQTTSEERMADIEAATARARALAENRPKTYAEGAHPGFDENGDEIPF